MEFSFCKKCLTTSSIYVCRKQCFYEKYDRKLTDVERAENFLRACNTEKILLRSKLNKSITKYLSWVVKTLCHDIRLDKNYLGGYLTCNEYNSNIICISNSFSRNNEDKTILLSSANLSNPYFWKVYTIAIRAYIVHTFLSDKELEDEKCYDEEKYKRTYI